MSKAKASQSATADFSAYFSDAAIPGPVQERVARLLEAVRSVVDDAIVDCFVSEYVNEDSTRTYESVWLFTDKAVIEGDFRTDDDDFDYAILTRNVVHLVTYRRAFDLSVATEASRLVLDVTLADQVEGTMRASGQNCVKLVGIMKSRLLPNLKRTP